MARPKKEDYMTEEILTRIGGWAKDGLTEQQIAENLGISLKSLGRWKIDSNESDGLSPIGRALKVNKEISDRNVENALFKSACGYNVEEVTLEEKVNPKTGRIETLEKRVTRHIPPSNTAQIFWLKNRKPDVWRDKRVVEDHVEFENDGFIDALKGQAAETFKDADNIVEE